MSSPASGSSAAPTQTAPTPSPAPTPSAPAAGQADFSLGTAATKVGLTDDNTFLPAAVTVHVGDIVEWDYNPNAFVPHNVVFAHQPSISDLADLGAKPNGQPGHGTWQVRFTLGGVYPYRCTFHPGMTGTVTVG